jgi:hypothetical protein
VDGVVGFIPDAGTLDLRVPDDCPKAKNSMPSHQASSQRVCVVCQLYKRYRCNTRRGAISLYRPPTALLQCLDT